MEIQLFCTLVEWHTVTQQCPGDSLRSDTGDCKFKTRLGYKNFSLKILLTDHKENKGESFNFSCLFSTPITSLNNVGHTAICGMNLRTHQWGSNSFCSKTIPQRSLCNRCKLLWSSSQASKNAGSSVDTDSERRESFYYVKKHISEQWIFVWHLKVSKYTHVHSWKVFMNGSSYFGIEKRNIGQNWEWTFCFIFSVFDHFQ